MSTPGATRTSNSFVNYDALLSVDDWLALPDTKPRYELIAGRLQQKPLKNFAQVKAIGEFFFAVAQWAEKGDWIFLVEGVGVKIDEYNGFVPNVLGFAPNFPVAPDANFVIAPFLALEISPSKKQRAHKRRFYARGGVTIYILLNPKNRTLEILRLQENKTYDDAEVLGENDVWQPEELPGLKLELQRLWMN